MRYAVAAQSSFVIRHSSFVIFMLFSTELAFSYGAERRFIFEPISLERGQQLLLLGESGSGKTTLMHLLAGLRRPQSGSVSIEGENLNELADKGRLDQFRGQRLGIVFQQSHLLRALTVAENLQAAQYFARKEQKAADIQQILASLGLGDKLRRYVHELSIGEQQRVAIARALINRPSLILADEPTSSLDDRNCQEVVRLLKEQSEAHNAALIIITHDARLKSEISRQITVGAALIS